MLFFFQRHNHQLAVMILDQAQPHSHWIVPPFLVLEVKTLCLSVHIGHAAVAAFIVTMPVSFAGDGKKDKHLAEVNI